MKIDFKYAIIAPIAGIIFVAALIFTAPLILSGLDLFTGSGTPSDDEVCAHLDSIETGLKDCKGFLEESREPMGKWYGHRSRCLMAATNQEEALRCDEPAEYMTSTWE